MAHDETSGEGGQALRPGRVVVSAEDLGRRVRALGAEITADYEGRAPLLVGVLKGAFMFMSDLARPSTCRSSSTSWPSPRTATPPGRPGWSA
jgi:hypothetical protein